MRWAFVLSPVVGRMGETTGAVEGRSPTVGGVQAAGVVCAGVATAGVLVPYGRGETGLAVVLAVALGVLTLGAFLGRRHGVLSRSAGSPLAAGSSLGVVLTAGYALNQGIMGTTTLAVGNEPWTLSLVSASVFAAGGCLGLAVADYGGLGSRAVADRTQQVAVFALVSLSVFLVASIWMSLVELPVFLVSGELSALEDAVVERVGMSLATATVVVAYLHATDRGRSFLDLRAPTVRDVGWVIGGIGLVLGSNYLISVIMTVTDVETVTHAAIESGQRAPEVLLALAVLSIPLTGPFEELLYRNVIQKSLYEHFSRPGAIVAASVVFTSVHFTAYAAAGAHLGATLASLSIVFALSIVLGTIYERTESLFVPAVVHGIYNAITFLVQYAGAT